MVYLIFLSLELLFLIIFMIVMGSLLYSNFRGAPWVRTPNENLDLLISQISISKDDVVIELGCGTGQVLRRLCRKSGALGIGVDINPILIWIARIISNYRGQTNIRYEISNIYDFPIKEASIIYLFLMPKMLEKLGPKLARELKKGTTIVSLGFKIPNMDEELSKKLKSKPYLTYLYIV